MVPERLQSDWQQDLTRGEFAQLLVQFLAAQYGYGNKPGSGLSLEDFLEDYPSLRPAPDGTPFSKADYLTEEENSPDSFYSWQGILSDRVNVFEDVEPGGPAADINLAYLLGVVKGRDATHYGPDGTITRQEAAALLGRTYGVYGTLEPKAGASKPFSDAAAIAPWAAADVAAMASWDILHGDENRAFSPLAHYTREQGVLAFLRLYKNMPVSRYNGTLAPLLSREDVVNRCLSGGPGATVLFRDETELCTILCMAYGGVMHPPGPAIFLIYPDSTYKRIDIPAEPQGFQLTEYALTFSLYTGEWYVLDLATGALRSTTLSWEPSEGIDYTLLLERLGRSAEVEGFYHRPFDELPQELRDSLKFVREVPNMEGYTFILREYTAPGITITTTQAPEEALQRWLDRQLSLPADSEERAGTDEEVRAEFELEKGREWLYSVDITDASYTTGFGLKVGAAIEEAEALGYRYPLGQPLTANGESSYGDTWNHQLMIYTENGVVTKLHLSWALGRYVGKYWDL